MKMIFDLNNENELYSLSYNLLEGEENSIGTSDSEETSLSEESTTSEVEFIDRLKNPDWKNFGSSFGTMGKGMLGIFIVILILIGGITLLNKLTSPKKNDDLDEE